MIERMTSPSPGAQGRHLGTLAGILEIGALDEVAVAVILSVGGREEPFGAPEQ